MNIQGSTTNINNNHHNQHNIGSYPTLDEGSSIYSRTSSSSITHPLVSSNNNNNSNMSDSQRQHSVAAGSVPPVIYSSLNGDVPAAATAGTSSAISRRGEEIATATTITASSVAEQIRYEYYRTEAFMHAINPSAFITCLFGMFTVAAMELGCLPHCRPIYSVRQLLYNEYISRGPYLVHDTFPSYCLAFVAMLPIICIFIPVLYIIKFRAAPSSADADDGEDSHSMDFRSGRVAVREESVAGATAAAKLNDAEATPKTTSVVSIIQEDQPQKRRRIRLTTKQFVIATMFIWTLVQCESLVLTLIVTDASKYYAGNYRPDFLGRLQHEGYLPEAPAGELFSSSSSTATAAGKAPSQAMQEFEEAAVNLFPYLCPSVGDLSLPPGYAPNSTLVDALQNNPLLQDGRKSFPSGHSSISFASMVPFCFFLAVEVFEPIKYRCLIRTVGSCLPLLLAFMIAISRTRDQRHHFSDILAGSVIGTVCAVVAFSLNFAAITHGMARSGFVSRHPVIAFQYEGDDVVANVVAGGDSTGMGHKDSNLLLTPPLDSEPSNTLFKTLYTRLFPGTVY